MPSASRDAETRRNGDAEKKPFVDTSAMQSIRSYKELRVYQAAIDAAMRIFEITKRFPPEERFSIG